MDKEAKGKVVIEFPTQELADEFVSWMSTSGEQAYGVLQDCTDQDPILYPRYDYENAMIYFEKGE